MGYGVEGMLYNSLNLSQLVEFFVKVDPIQEITPITQDKISKIRYPEGKGREREGARSK